MPSVLASAVVNITASTVGFNAALRLVQAGLTGFLTGASDQLVKPFLMKPVQAQLSQAKDAFIKAQKEVAQKSRDVSYYKDMIAQGFNFKKELVQAKSDLAIAKTNLSAARADVTAAHGAVKATATEYAGIAEGIVSIGMASVAAVAGVFSLTVALGKLAFNASGLRTTMLNVERTFGSSSVVIKNAADAAVERWGVARSEFLGYAESFGLMLKQMGVEEGRSATMAAQLTTAARELASSRGISFESAFKEVSGSVHGGTTMFDESRIKARAVENGLIGNRNQLLSKQAELMVRYQLTLEAVNEQQNIANLTGNNWNDQIQRLMGQLSNLGETIGTIVLPAFIAFFENVNNWLNTIVANWDSWIARFPGMAEGLKRIGEGFGTQTDMEKQIAADDAKRIAFEQGQTGAADRKRAGKESVVGQVFGGAGGASGGRGFQGGLAEFAKKVQESAFSNRQIGLLEQQNERAGKIAENTGILAEAEKKKKANMAKAAVAAPWF